MVRGAFFAIASRLAIAALVIASLSPSMPAKANPGPSAQSIPPTADAPSERKVYACRIGKPSYCYKYGGNRCPKVNTLGTSNGTVDANCDAWTAACLDCHAAIPACIGRPRPAADSLTCTECSAAWRGCMDRIDATYWPNRLAR